MSIITRNLLFDPTQQLLWDELKKFNLINIWNTIYLNVVSSHPVHIASTQPTTVETYVSKIKYMFIMAMN